MRYLLICPEMVLFGDEVGDNTSQKNDGNIGRQKFIINTNQHPLIQPSYADSHFTILGFMTTAGQSVCCIVIMACQEVEAKHVLGIQPWAEINGEVTTNLDKNANGTNKYCPYGPTCVYNGKEMPCYPTSSENGSITSDILAQIMQYLNHHVGFNQTEATSFLLLDGHGSRSGLSFDNKPSIIMTTP